MIRRGVRDIRGVIDRRARFRYRLAVHGHLPGDDQRPRPMALRRELPIEQYLIKSYARHATVCAI
jgi:hypothetical protein